MITLEEYNNNRKLSSTNIIKQGGIQIWTSHQPIKFKEFTLYPDDDNNYTTVYLDRKLITNNLKSLEELKNINT